MLQSTGKISFSNVNTELGLATNTRRTLGSSSTRTLFGVASGRIKLSDGYGKSNRVSVTVTLASNTANYTLSSAQIPGYVAGKTDVTLIVNPGVYVYSTNTANAGLTIATLNAADTVAITNNGYIIGMGGQGGFYNNLSNGQAGGPALTINRNVTFTNNSYIAGGGGGGVAGSYGGGGGGAGGGGGGLSGRGFAGGSGGAPGLAGSNGVYNNDQFDPNGGGGGGGRILPGVGGVSVDMNSGRGGGSGGSGAMGGNGGNANNVGSNGTSGGGGGWGAAGGSSTTQSGTPGTGGKAVNLNGYTVTWLATGTRYGAIS